MRASLNQSRLLQDCRLQNAHAMSWLHPLRSALPIVVQRLGRYIGRRARRCLPGGLCLRLRCISSASSKNAIGKMPARCGL